MFISILTIVYFYRQIVSIYIAIQYIDQNSYNMITVYYISKNSYKVYRYKDLIWHIRCQDVDDEMMRYLIIGGMMRQIMFTKNHIMCNTYARMNCISSIDTVEKNSLYNCRIRLTRIIMRYLSHFHMKQWESAIFRRFLYQQHFPGRGLGYG